MRIVRVIINNFRTIHSLLFYPSQHNMIIGQVNSGKSTLLQALALVLDPDTGRRSQIIDETDFYAMKWLDDGGKPIPILVEITLAGCSDPEKNIFLEFWEPWNDKEKNLKEDADNIKILDDKSYEFAFRIAFKAVYDPSEDGFQCYWYYPKFSFTGDSTDHRSCTRTDREKTGFFLIPAERDARKALSFARYSVLDKALRADEVRLETQLRKIIEHVKGQGDYLFDNQGFSTLIEEMENQIGGLLRLRRDAPRKLSFELSDLGHYDVMNVLRAFIALEDQELSYPVSRQGVGARQVLVLAALRMLSKRRQSAIVAVEEPETGLHPHMQRALVDGLLRASSQTFITTHSVHVAQIAQANNICCLQNQGKSDHRIVPAQQSDTYGCSVDTIRAVSKLRGHYPMEVLDALFAPSVLLVEGPGDREALPILFRQLCRVPNSSYRDLDGLGIAIVPCQSKESIYKIAPYFRHQLGKRVFALADNESSTKHVNSQISNACDYTFLWPDGYAIEKILLFAAKDSTISSFIDKVAEYGDTYFDHAGSVMKDAVARRQDVFSYLKDNKTGMQRHFAELLSSDEIAPPVRSLLGALNSIIREDASMPPEVPLGIQTN